MRLVFDIETDGLLPQLTRVHSLVIQDLDSGKVYSCADRPGWLYVRDGLELLEKADIIFGHNIVGFDLPALRKVYPAFKPRGQVRDTLLWSRLRYAHLKESDYKLSRRSKLPGHLIGSHKLEAWGYRLGVLKGKFGDTTDWSAWSVEMQKYCERDVRVTERLVKFLEAKGGVTDEALETEHELTAYLEQQERNGFPFNEDDAVKLYGTLAGRKAGLTDELVGTFGELLVRNGQPVTPKRDNRKKGVVAGAPYSKLKLVTFNPGSRDHIAKAFYARHGWVPEELTETGKAKVDESILGALPYPEAKLLNEYLLVGKRLGQLGDGKNGWLKLARPNPQTGLPHIHGRCTSIGAVTHRAAHSSPNMGQVPKVTSPYGTECRALFTVPAGWTLLGADASGLELRCLAHYMAKYDGGAYVKVLLEGRNEDGTDIHSVNRNVLGLSGKEGRDRAKTFIYAYLYGAGDAKLGWIMDPYLDEEEAKRLGKKLRKRFVAGLPALGRLVEDVKLKAANLGYLRLIDGRRAYVRAEHSALNTLLQGTGAVICKRWIVTFNRRLTDEFGPQGWSGQWAALAWVHDEVQNAFRPAIAERASTIIVESIRDMTAHFSFRCPLDGEAKLGPHWAATH